jgi:Fe-S cluster assembly iron-binding protein IscA
VLTMTTDAVHLLREARSAAEVPDCYGVRILGEQDAATGVIMGLGFAEEPFPGDQVTEQEGMRLFGAREVAEPLSATTIDASKDDGEPRLLLCPSEAEGGEGEATAPGENGGTPAS